MNATTTKTDWTADCISDVYLCAPHPEDGECREALAFYVVCTNSFGDRFASTAILSEDMGRHEADKRARRLCSKVRDYLKLGFSPVNSAKWERTYPVYGSEAYAAYGEKEQIAHEIKSADLGPQEERRLLVAAGCVA